MDRVGFTSLHPILFQSDRISTDEVSYVRLERIRAWNLFVAATLACLSAWRKASMGAPRSSLSIRRTAVHRPPSSGAVVQALRVPVVQGATRASTTRPTARRAPVTRVVKIMPAFEGMRMCGSPPAFRSPRTGLTAKGSARKARRAQGVN